MREEIVFYSPTLCLVETQPSLNVEAMAELHALLFLREPRPLYRFPLIPASKRFGSI